MNTKKLRISVLLIIGLILSAAFWNRSSQESLRILSDHNPLAISSGDITTHKMVHKSGRNTAIGTSYEDVWDGGGDYFYLTTGNALWISSDSLSDDEVIVIIGLDENWELDTLEQALVGTTKTQVMKDNGDPGRMIRVFRAYNSSGTLLVGTTYVYGDITPTAGVPGTADSIRAVITTLDQQTEMALFTVPANKHIDIVRFWFSLNDRTASRALTYGVDVRIFGGIFRTQFPLGLTSTGMNNANWPIEAAPIHLDAKTDIKIRAIATASLDASAGFDFVMNDQ